MNGNVSGEVLTGTISGTVKISGDLIPRGIDGVSPTIELEPIDGGTRIIITDINGTKQFEVQSEVSSEQVEALVKEHLEKENAKTLYVGIEVRDGNATTNVPYADIKAAYEKGYAIIGDLMVDLNYGLVVAPLYYDTEFFLAGLGFDMLYHVAVISENSVSHESFPVEIGAESLSEAVNTALAQAKASGEFDGKDGKDGSNGRDGVSATHSWNGTTLTVTSASGTSSANLKGEKGDSIKGDPGNDGVSPTVSVSKSGKVTTVSITDKNGTKTAKINDGADGASGSNGKDGTPATHSWNGTTLTITSASGTSSANLKGEPGAAGSNGKDGTSVTVKSVSESTADGGSNVVTFSDGKTLTVKNGKTGSGAAGKSAYQYAVDGGYTGTEAEFAVKMAAEGAKVVRVRVEVVNGNATTDVPYADIKAAYQNGDILIGDLMVDYNYGLVVAPLYYDTEFYLCGFGFDMLYHVAVIGESSVYYESFPVSSESPDPSEPGRTVTPDWKAAEGEAGYIKNKPAGVGYVDNKLLFPETELTLDEDYGYVMPEMVLVAGNTYEITYNGTKYTCKAVNVDGIVAVGNYLLEESGEPFSVGYVDGFGCLMEPLDEPETVTVKIEGEVVTKIDPKFYDSGVFWVDVFSDDDYRYTVITPNTLLTAVNSGRPVIARYHGYLDGIGNMVENLNLVCYAQNNSGELISMAIFDSNSNFSQSVGLLGHCVLVAGDDPDAPYNVEV